MLSFSAIKYYLCFNQIKHNDKTDDKKTRSTRSALSKRKNYKIQRNFFNDINFTAYVSYNSNVFCIISQFLHFLTSLSLLAFEKSYFTVLAKALRINLHRVT